MPFPLRDIINIPALLALIENISIPKPLSVSLIGNDKSLLFTIAKQKLCIDFHCLPAYRDTFCFLNNLPQQLSGEITSNKKGKKFYEQSREGGLTDIIIPIKINGKCYASLFLGHFFHQPPDATFFSKQAQKYDFNVDQFLKAIQKIPVLTKTQIDTIIDTYLPIIDYLSQCGEQQISQLLQHVELQKSEKRFRSFFQHSAVPITIISPQGSILAANQANCKTLGYTEQELLTFKFKDLIHPEDLPESGSIYDNVLTELTEVIEFEKRYQSKHETLLWGHTTIAPVSDASGKLLFCIALIQDITKRKRIEKELQSAHQNLKDIIAFLPDATFVIDRQGTVVAWNRAIEKMTGVKAENMLGKNNYAYAAPFYGKQRPILIDLVEDQNPQLKAHYDFEVTDNNILHAEAYVASAYSKKGAYLSGIAAPLFDHDGNHVGAIESIRDISEQKQAEETLRQRTRMLEETNTALKVLLRESAEAKEDLERKVLANVKELIIPYINELKGLLTDKQQEIYLQTITTNLYEITSSFTRQLSSHYIGLTPREIQIADFIRQGKSNKEIAYLLKISVSAIDFHRRNLREKLNIKGKKTNLRSFLLAHMG